MITSQMNHVCLVQCTVQCSNTKAELATFEFRKVEWHSKKISPPTHGQWKYLFATFSYIARRICRLGEQLAKLLSSEFLFKIPNQNSSRKKNLIIKIIFFCYQTESYKISWQLIFEHRQTVSHWILLQLW